MATLHKGSQGEQVHRLIELLRIAGHDVPGTDAFDDVVDKTVRGFQVTHDLEPSGIVTHESWVALVTAASQAAEFPTDALEKLAHEELAKELLARAEDAATEDQAIFERLKEQSIAQLDGPMTMPGLPAGELQAALDDWSSKGRLVVGGVALPGPDVSRGAVARMAEHAAAARQTAVRAGLEGSVVTQSSPDSGGGEGPGAAWEERPEEEIGAATDPHRHPPLMEPGHQLHRIALALSGGGSKGDFELGAARFLYDHILRSDLRSRPDIITGTSVGAVNAGKLSEGGIRSIDQLERIWFGLVQNSDMYVPAPEAGDVDIQVARVLSRAGWGLGGLLFLGPIGLAFLWAASEEARSLYDRLITMRSLFTLEPVRQRSLQHQRYWSPTGPGVRGTSVSVTFDVNGRAVVFARGYDDRLYAKWAETPGPLGAATVWRGWHDLGGPITSDPVATLDDRGTLTVVARMAHEDGFAHRTLPGGDVTRLDWRAWVPIERPAGSLVVGMRGNPSLLVRTGDRALRMFARDENDQAYVSTRVNEHWLAWRWFGGSYRLAGRVAAASWGTDGSTALFGRAVENTILVNVSTGSGWTFGNWRTFGGLASSDITATNNADGSIEVFWRGPDGQVWARRQVPGGGDRWGDEQPLDGLVSSNIAAARDRSGRIVLAARGLDYAIWLKRQDAANAPWISPDWLSIGSPAGLEIHSDPMLCRQPDGTLCVFAVASDKSLWCCVEEGERFSPWFSLAGKVWTGIQLRLAIVALEDGRMGYVDEAGKFVGTYDRLVSVTEAIIASSAIPGVFPAVPLNGTTWVDGGVRRSTPIRAAIDAGATEVFAIAASPAVPPRRTNALPRTLRPDREVFNHSWIDGYADANLLDVGIRAVVDLFPSGVMQSDLEPETPWEKPVWVIRPTFEVHDALTIDRGLIRINHAYGWLRASDITASLDPNVAIESTDAITRLRHGCWQLETAIRHEHLIAVLRQAAERAADGSDRSPEQTASWAGQAVISQMESLRVQKRALADALRHRRDLGLSVPPAYERWPAQWEGHSRPAEWDRSWEGAALSAQPPTGPWTALSFTSFTGETYSIGAAAAPSV